MKRNLKIPREFLWICDLKEDLAIRFLKLFDMLITHHLLRIITEKGF